MNARDCLVGAMDAILAANARVWNMWRDDDPESATDAMEAEIDALVAKGKELGIDDLLGDEWFSKEAEAMKLSIELATISGNRDLIDVDFARLLRDTIMKLQGVKDETGKDGEA